MDTMINKQQLAIPQERIALLIGNLHIQILALQEEIEKLKKEKEK